MFVAKYRPDRWLRGLRSSTIQNIGRRCYVPTGFRDTGLEMNNRLLAIVVLALILPLAAIEYTFSQWRDSGELIEDDPSQKSVGNFAAMLRVTDQPQALFSAWEHAESPDYGPSYSEASTVHRGDFVMAFVVFSGCAEDADGNCNCSIEYTAYFPDGSVYGQHGGPLWVGYPDPGKGFLQLSEGNLGLRFESDDALGTYEITADITDNISGQRISLSTQVTVADPGQIRDQKTRSPER